MTNQNRDVVGALVVDLGLVQAAWSVSEPVASGFVAYGVAEALKHCPRALTDSELATRVLWAQTVTAAAPSEADDDGDWMNRVTPPTTFQRRGARTLLQVAKDVQRFRQRQEVLHGADPVVYRDRRELLDRLTRLQVDAGVLQLLHDADREAAQGDHKAALQKLRTFLERTCESCCVGAGAKAGAPPVPPKQGGNIKPWRTTR